MKFSALALTTIEVAAAFLDPSSERGGLSTAVAFGAECNPLGLTSSYDGQPIVRPDVGVLLTSGRGRSSITMKCASDGDICVVDPSSSLGGRCVDGGGGAPFSHRASRGRRRVSRGGRRRQEEEVPDFGKLICDQGSSCNAALCDCKQNGGNRTNFTSYATDCAPEMAGVCSAGTVDACFEDPEYEVFYKDYVCSFSQCISEGESYIECSCAFSRKYCDGYASYYQMNPNSTTYPEYKYYCEEAQCCDAAVSDVGGQRACFKEIDWDAAYPGDVGSSTVAPSPAPTKGTTAAPVAESTPGESDAPTAAPSPAPTKGTTAAPVADPTSGAAGALMVASLAPGVAFVWALTFVTEWLIF